MGDAGRGIRAPTSQIPCPRRWARCNSRSAVTRCRATAAAR
jgi:hypothetical protein